MRRYIYSIVVILFFKISGFAQSYGLTFNSHEVVLEKRTSLDLSPEDSLCFAKNFELGFDINFLPGHQIYFGYVLRIVSTDNQNIDLILTRKPALSRSLPGRISRASVLPPTARDYIRSGTISTSNSTWRNMFFGLS